MTTLKELTSVHEQNARGLELTQLEATLAKLEVLFEQAKGNEKVSIAHSLGLAYRRLGERGQTELLHKALSTFEEGEGECMDETLCLELKNNKAIAWIRLFELEGKEAYLSAAEQELNFCREKLSQVPASIDQEVRANICNNIGNLWKQRYCLSGNVEQAHQAIEFYTQAALIWSETAYPYYWAATEKNIGEVQYLVGKMTKDTEWFTRALEHCLNSLRYRTQALAPYQWLKSVKIVLDIILLCPAILSGKFQSNVQSLIKELEDFFQKHQEGVDPQLVHKLYLVKNNTLV